MKKTVKIGISIGDFNGIGLEVILKCFKDKRLFDFCTPVLFAEQNMIITRKKSLGLDDVFVNSITHVKEAKNKKINVINCWKEQVKTDLGKSSIEAGKYAFTSLKKATQSLKKKKLMF